MLCLNIVILSEQEIELTKSRESHLDINGEMCTRSLKFSVLYFRYSVVICH